MVRFCLLTTLLFFSTNVYRLIPQHIPLQKDESDKVFNVLEQFLQPTKPLNIGYLGSEHETLSTKTTIVTQAIKQVLKKIDPVFTDQCLSKISLGDTNMIPGIAVKVPLFYHLKNYGGSYEEIDIYIKENLSPFKETAREIAKKIKLECHLKNYCYQKMMDNPVVVEDIRQGLVGQKVLSAVEAQYVQPEHQMLTSNHKYKLRVVKDGKNRIFSTYSFYCKPIF